MKTDSARVFEQVPTVSDEWYQHLLSIYQTCRYQLKLTRRLATDAIWASYDW